jgi:UDP-N-acetylglucosamine/UDP-N-acetylgalactosamine diphosphorylase
MFLSTKKRLILEKKLEPEDIQNLFRCWDKLSTEERTRLTTQIERLDPELLEKQKKLMKHPVQRDVKRCQPFLDFEQAGNETDRFEGLSRIKKGQMGCLLLAGGQGSRLGYSLAKGRFPVSVIKNKSLFQLCAEKVLAAGKQAGCELPLAIMTSPLNAEEIESFFLKHDFFGLNPGQTFFYTQEMLPLLNKKGHLFLEGRDKIAMGPSGNGFSLQEFVKAGIWAKWNNQGIRYLNMIPIDNPLADPFDAELLGFHCRRKLDVSSKSVEKIEPNEKVGVFVKEGDQYGVIEYSEMDEESKKAKESGGRLIHRCASLTLFCFSMDFVKKMSTEDRMPLHLANKSVPYLDDSELTQISAEPNAVKFESFIFDVLNHTDKLAALLCERRTCFSPLKNLKGNNSPESVKLALQARDREIYTKITGLAAPSESFELAADFYYPTPELLSRWKNKPIKGGYIEP